MSVYLLLFSGVSLLSTCFQQAEMRVIGSPSNLAWIARRLSQPGAFDAATGGIVGAASKVEGAAVLMLYPFLATGAGAVVSRVGNEIAEDSKAAK